MTNAIFQFFTATGEILHFDLTSKSTVLDAKVALCQQTSEYQLEECQLRYKDRILENSEIILKVDPEFESTFDKVTFSFTLTHPNVVLKPFTFKSLAMREFQRYLDPNTLCGQLKENFIKEFSHFNPQTVRICQKTAKIFDCDPNKAIGSLNTNLFYIRGLIKKTGLRTSHSARENSKIQNKEVKENPTEKIKQNPKGEPIEDPLHPSLDTNSFAQSQKNVKLPPIISANLIQQPEQQPPQQQPQEQGENDMNSKQSQSSPSSPQPENEQQDAPQPPEHEPETIPNKHKQQIQPSQIQLPQQEQLSTEEELQPVQTAEQPPSVHNSQSPPSQKQQQQHEVQPVLLTSQQLTPPLPQDQNQNPSEEQPQELIQLKQQERQQQIPQEHQQIPQEHQYIPQEQQQIPQEQQQIPQEHQQIPQEHQQTPQEQQQIPQELEQQLHLNNNKEEEEDGDDQIHCPLDISTPLPDHSFRGFTPDARQIDMIRAFLTDNPDSLQAFFTWLDSTNPVHASMLRRRQSAIKRLIGLKKPKPIIQTVQPNYQTQQQQQQPNQPNKILPDDLPPPPPVDVKTKPIEVPAFYKERFNTFMLFLQKDPESQQSFARLYATYNTLDPGDLFGIFVACNKNENEVIMSFK